MSIIVNTQRGNLTDSTIMRFRKDAVLSSPPLPANHPLLGARPKKAIVLGRGCFQVDWAPCNAETVIIKCMFLPNVQGILYGCEDHSIAAILEGQSRELTIRWYINGQNVYTVYNPPMRYCTYGFIGGKSGSGASTTYWIKPYFDDKAIGTTEYVVSGTETQAIIGGLTGGSSDSWLANENNPNQPAILIQEVYAFSRVLPVYSHLPDGHFHYYACLKDDDYYAMMETLRELKFAYPIGEYFDVVDFSENEKGYGVQVFDLRHAFGSRFRGFIPLAFEDGGIDTSLGWTNNTADYWPSKLVKSGQTDRNFAFYIGNTTTHIPMDNALADGWTPTKQGGTGYELGELIKGHKPKWNIWNDVIKFGLYVHKNVDNTLAMRFNALRIIDVSATTGAPHMSTIDGKTNLIWFDGYSANSAFSHPPMLTVTNNSLAVHIHNGAMSRCLASDVMAGLPSTYLDNQCVFKLNTNVGSTINCRVGNMAFWNFTETELNYYGYAIKGVKLSLTSDPGTYEYANASSIESSIFSSDSSSTIMNKYRYNGVDCPITLTKENQWRLYDLIMNATNKTYPLLGKMTLVESSNADIDCSRLVPTKSFNAVGHVDEAINSSSINFRAIVDLNGVDQSNYLLGVVGKEEEQTSPSVVINPVALSPLYVVTGSGHYSCIAIQLIRCHYDSNNDLIPDYDTTVDSSYKKFKAFIEVYTKRTNSDTISQFTTMINSMNGISEFAKYCQYGSPTASSRLTGWSPQSSLFSQMWYTAYTVNPNKRHTVWNDGNWYYFPRDTTSSGSVNFTYAATSTRTILVPRRMLFGDNNTEELTNNTTMIAHIYDYNTTTVISSFYGDLFSTEHHQKTLLVSNFYSGVNMLCVAAQPYYERKSTDTKPIQFFFRTYLWYNDQWTYYSNLGNYTSTNTHAFIVELYKNDGNPDWALLANGNYVAGGTKVATFNVLDKTDTYTDNGYTLTFRNDAATPTDTYFYPWGGEATNAAFNEIQISGQGLEGGTYFSIRILKY